MSIAPTSKAKPAAKPAVAKPAAAPASAPEVAAAPPAPPEPVAAPVEAVAAEPVVTAAGPEAVDPVVTVAQDAAAKSTEEALATARENLEAVVKAGQLLSKGLQDLSKSVLALTQEAVEDSVASTKKLLAAKTLHEAVDLHSAHAKNQIDRLLAEGSRLGDSTRKLMEEAIVPIQERVHATVDKLTKLTRH